MTNPSTMKKLITGLFLFFAVQMSLKAKPIDSFIGADLIVFNAKITTQTGSIMQASALAVKRGRIYAIGSDAEILTLKDKNTKVIDAEGRRLIPGLMDSHVHVLNERNYNYNVRWDGVPTIKRALEM